MENTMTLDTCTKTQKQLRTYAASQLHDKYVYSYKNMPSDDVPLVCQPAVRRIVTEGQTEANQIETVFNRPCTSEGCRALKEAFQWECNNTPDVDSVQFDRGIMDSQIDLYCPGYGNANYD